MIGVYAGEIGAKRADLEAILEQQKEVHKDGWNVATSPRRDVPTSRRPHVATSQHPHVVKSQRRDVGSTNIKTSRRLNVATLQRRDFRASSVFSSLKTKRGAYFEVSGIVRTRARKSEQR